MKSWIIIVISCLLARGAWGQALDWTTPASGSAAATTAQVAEDETAAVTVETLAATGGTAGTGYTYAIVNVDGDTTAANWKFELTGADLKSKASQSFDYESKKKYEVVVTAVDTASPPATITGTVTAELSDADDHTSTFPYSCGYATRDAISGDVVGNYQVCDDDVADTITYAIASGNDDGYFTLTGSILTKSAKAFASDASSSYNLVITAAGATNTATTTVSIVLGQTCPCPGSSGSSGLSFGIFTMFAAFVLQKI